MYYLVIGADGARYGPADIDGLIRWVDEGRIINTTILVEYGTENELRADSLTAVAAALRRRPDFGAGVTIERPVAGPQTAPSQQTTQTVAGPGPVRPVPPVPPIPVAQPADGSPPFYHYASFNGAVGTKSKVVAGLLGIFLGGLGIHRFYLGYTGVGLLMLLLSVTCSGALLPVFPGAGCGLVAVWGFIEGILCLSGRMRDAKGMALQD